MSFYGRKDYWDERYSVSVEPFEWYLSYSCLRFLFNPYNLSATQGINPAKPRRVLEARDRDAYMPHNPVELPLLKVNFPSRSSSRVLILGCGNSLLGEDMLRDGWTGGIVSVDWSQVVIDQMKAKYSPEYLQTIVDDIKIPTGSKKVAECNSDCDTKLMDYVCANVLDGLDFEDGSFDLIVVKGLFDSILSASIPSSNAQKVNEECHRLLKNSHGSLVIVSNGSPENRLVYLEHPGAEWWNAIGVHNIPKPRSDRRHILDRDAPKFFHAYVCRKRPQVGKSEATKTVNSGDLLQTSSDEENVASSA